MEYFVTVYVFVWIFQEYLVEYWIVSLVEHVIKYYYIITIFLDPVLDMEFLKGKNGYYMNQLFKLFSEDTKVAFYAVEQAAITPETCT